ncbi:MAG: integrin [Burkholderiales bacterium]|nr:integrin [Burkholderiales bacterium]MCA3160803.1 integrin [Burkholderiales bacterium]MCA3163592.1 integrin [Burkholderiales bacterium]MCA3166270.1 integrin [Burkholderiales bacterium]MCA3170104.1 integrin [Burkholderiales bacterium]
MTQTLRYAINPSHFLFVSLLVLGLLAGCGGGAPGAGGGGTPGTPETAPAAPNVSLAFAIKQSQLSWPAVSGATHYRIWESPNESTDFTQVGGDQTSTSATRPLALHLQLNARYRVQACNTSGCTNSATVTVASQLTPTNLRLAVGYVKASNTAANDEFGTSVALSGDGNTLAVGAPGEDGSASNSGAVYVFTRSGGSWSQQGSPIKATSPAANDRFGSAVALSNDGNTLAVGAPGRNADAGSAYVFVRSGISWTEEDNRTASNAGAGDQFGTSVALSNDGNTLAVGAPFENSSVTGINQPSDELADDSGAAYVFVRSVATWSQEAFVKASNTDEQDNFGRAVVLSNDGNTLAVGAPGEDSADSANQNDETALSSGAAYVYFRSGTAWDLTPPAYIKASNPDAQDAFGHSLALSGDGSTLAVGAYREASNATVIGGDQSNNSAPDSGAVYVFLRSGTTWNQQAYVKASNTQFNDQFGWALALSSDGNTLVVGARYEDSNATGVGGDQTNNTPTNSGAAYAFVRSGGTWAQRSYVKASNTGSGDQFAWSLALSADGNTLTVGANNEDSNATGVGGDPDNDGTLNSGAAYLY